MLKVYSRKSTHYAYLCLFIAQLMVAINVVGSKVISTHVAVLPALFLRFSIATVVSFLMCFVIGRQKADWRALSLISKSGWLYLGLQGVCAGALFNAFIFWGLQTVSASLAGMILSLLPAVIAIIALFFLKEKLTFNRLFCILLAIVGVAVLHFSPSLSTTSTQGIILVMMSLLPEAAYYLLIKAYQPPINIYLKSAILNVMNVISLLPFVIVSGISIFKTLDLLTIEVLLITGSSATLFFIFWYLGAKNMMASRAGIFTAINPLLTVFISMLFLGESIGPIQWLGMCIIIASVIVSSLKG